VLFNNKRGPGSDDHEVIASRRKFIINFVFFLILFGISILLVRYALPALISFCVAFIVTLILRPLLKFFTEKLKFNRKTMALILVLLFYATIGIAVVFIIISVINWGSSVVAKLPDFYKNNIAPGLSVALEKINTMLEEIGDKLSFDNLHPGGLIPEDTTAVTDAVTDAVESIAGDGATTGGAVSTAGGINIDLSDTVNKMISSLGTSLAEFSKNIVSKTPQIATAASSALLNVIICIISTTFLLTDFDLISNFIHKQMKPEHSEKLNQISSHLGKVLKKYILSYALIMFITFSEILIGLLIIRMPNAPLISAVVAIFDILPIVGSGMVLLPWAIITLILGNFGRGIGLLILWAVVVVVRQIIEPKIVGNHVGMHPLLTLFAMIAGNFVYGGIGILLVPVTLALIQSLNEDGVIALYAPLDKKDIPAEENGRIVTAVSKPVHQVWKTFTRINTKARDDIEKAKKRAEEKKKEPGKNDQTAAPADNLPENSGADENTTAAEDKAEDNTPDSGEGKN